MRRTPAGYIESQVGASKFERVFKYHGLGNDFVVLDRRSAGRDIDPQAVRQLCDRRRGIGADGVLVLLPSKSSWARMIVHNADGSPAEMCGNGLRCVVKYLADEANDKPDRVQIETEAGVLSCEVEYRNGAAQQVRVEMGPARLVADNLPSRSSGQPFVEQELSGFPGVRGTAVSMGNPHLVLFGRPLEEAASLGPRLERYPGFLGGTNVEFVQQDPSGLTVRVWERGAGLTEACGTGACAAVAAGVWTKRLSSGEWNQVRLSGGALQVRGEADLSAIQMRGPAEFVFEAQIPGLL